MILTEMILANEYPRREQRLSWRSAAHATLAAHVAFATTFFVVALLSSSPASAVIVISDGFGDADLNNNGMALEGVDADVGLDSDGGNLTTYIPGRLTDGTGTEPTNNEVTTVLDAGDTGLRWLQMRGFTGSNEGDSKPTARIVDDTQGAMLGTTAVGPAGALGATAINDGYALSYNSKGRGSSIAAFFDQTISLGPEVGDSVKVSFDFRIWRDSPNANNVLAPEDAELRFGLYQDTGNQLGQTNPVAGRAFDSNNDGFLDAQPAVWGQEEGRFEGGQINATPGSEIGATGDSGWFGAVIIEDPNGAFPPITPNGGGWRIREETNEAAGAGPRILQGADADAVAVPQEANPGAGDFGLTNLNVNNVWNLSLELIRATDTTPGDTITANLTATDITSGSPGASFTLTGTEPLMRDDGLGGMEPDGISSDSWDYFGIRNTGFDDFDFILDNFALEVFGSTAATADIDGDGDVDGADFLEIQRTNPSLISQWESEFGNSVAVTQALATAVPEPAGLVLLLLGLGGMGMLRGTQRTHR